MLNWISRKVKTIVAKQQKRYGKYLGLSIAAVVVISLPLPVPGVGLSTALLGEVFRLVGIRF